jgi:hypothetical protein
MSDDRIAKGNKRGNKRGKGGGDVTFDVLLTTYEMILKGDVISFPSFSA